ncbi:hypothetical protein [Mucilaginibacter sp.]|jgi:hypothetical protein|uniref:hypothetical protein n=1 Tax=Mucilaginibacter sp. TaxID=1882438 RepID=UPI0035658964
MKIRSFIIGSFILILLSCDYKKPSAKTGEKGIVAAAKTEQIPSTIRKASEGKEHLKRLSFYSKDHHFSNEKLKDNFTIKFPGRSIDSGIVVFEIKSSLGHLIFKKEFPASDLLADMADALSRKQKIDTVNARLTHFFDESNFVCPAIDNTDEIGKNLDDPNAEDIANWNEIKALPNSIGFYFSYGYEGTYGIAYSKKKKKAVVIFYSD